MCKDCNKNVEYLNALYIVSKTAEDNRKCKRIHQYKSCKQCSLFITFCKANRIKDKVSLLKEIRNSLVSKPKNKTL